MEPVPLQVLWIITVLLFVPTVITMLAKSSCASIGDAWLKETADDGNRKAKRLLKIMKSGSSSVTVGLEMFWNLTSVSVCVVVSATACRFMSERGDIHIGGVLLTVLCLWLVLYVFAAAVPKRIASGNPERYALSLSVYVFVINYVMKPFVVVFECLATFVSRLFGVKNVTADEEVTEEEIRMMVDMGSESGAIDDDEKQMIHNIFEMDDKPVDEIMTHRKDTIILWIEDSVEEWKEIIDTTNHTRYPVCSESIDDVIGIVTSRDFYRMLLNGKNDRKAILREAYFIPETIKADELLSQMQKENEHMGVVMDEYGGFQGLVTQEDLIEEIVGELYSEYDEPKEMEEENIKKLSENEWIISGSTEIEEVEEALGIKTDEGDYNTFAGLLLSELQTIPADGEVFDIEIENMKIKVTSVVDHRIEKAIVSLIKKDDESEDELRKE